MTGAVDWGTLTWLVTVLISAVTGAVGMMAMGFRLLRGRDEANGRMREEIDAQIASVDDELQAFKLHAAETYATKNGTEQAVKRVENAVDGLSGKMEKGFERISNRIDKLFEGGVAKTGGGP